MMTKYRVKNFYTHREMTIEGYDLFDAFVRYGLSTLEWYEIK